MPNHYKVIPSQKGYYFLTDHKNKYFFYFLDSGSLYARYKSFRDNIYNFIFELEEGEMISDKKVSETISHALLRFFANEQNILTFTCESIDGKHKSRHKLFHKWFCEYNTIGLIKYDYVVTTQEMEIYNSVMFLESHPHKEKIIRAFQKVCMEINIG